jgi:hypothetical protein
LSIINFIFCFWTADLTKYTSSPVYVVEIFFQICMSMLLTCLMLHAGLKLYGRIQGAAGRMDGSSSSTNNSVISSSSKTTNNISLHSYPPSTPLPPPIPAIPGERNSSSNSAAFSSSNPLNSRMAALASPDAGNRQRLGTNDSSQLTDSERQSYSLRASDQSTTVSNKVPNNGGNIHISLPNPNGPTNQQVTDNSAEFRTALLNLNIVMASCTLCVMLQVSADASSLVSFFFTLSFHDLLYLLFLLFFFYRLF